MNAITVCRPRFVTFTVRARERGRRRYEIIGGTRSRKKAYRMLAETMEQHTRYKRGDVLGQERQPSYYEPMVLVEMIR